MAEGTAKVMDAVQSEKLRETIARAREKGVMVKAERFGSNTRVSFAKTKEIPMPDLVEVQKKSYKWFLEEGLKDILENEAKITDFSNTLELQFLPEYMIDDAPKYSILECKERDATYAIPLRIKARLINKETHEIKEQTIYMGEFPKMTETGTFIINGAERVVVSQLVRSPGMYYNIELDKLENKLYSSTIIPYRGAWIEYETDTNGISYVRIDKNRKMHITALVRALLPQGQNYEIREIFGDELRLAETMEKDGFSSKADALIEIYKKLRPGELPTEEGAQNLLEGLFFDTRRYDLSMVGRYKFNKKMALAARISGKELAEDAVSELTGEIIAPAGTVIDRDTAHLIEDSGVVSVVLRCERHERTYDLKVFSNGMVSLSSVMPSLADMNIEEKVSIKVLKEILSAAAGDEAKIRAGIMEKIKDLIPNYITVDDIFASINYFFCLDYMVGTADDIDHLSNRRLRSVGELMQNQFRIGFSRMERVIRERLTTQETEIVTPQSLINNRPVIAAVKEFFGSSPLSQFMDQNNPISELTHKRRISALGPGGLSRERASFEVRDVHYSHYGRMCPIETPEGPNIGLISYLAAFAKINDFGFIEAPYKRCVQTEYGMQVTDEVRYMMADEEDQYIIAQASEPLDEQGCFVNRKIKARHLDQILEIEQEKIDYCDVSPKMMVSIVTAMIPFLENDDANRALMGANMQRQAVPLLITRSPIVGTGIEHKTAVDSGVCVVAKRGGVIKKVSANEIIVAVDGSDVDKYQLIKFLRSNQGTCINQRPIVKLGQRVEAGDVIADGPSTENGEMALGKNVLIGFMTWEGYNYEDAVLLNENLVKDDVFTSIHIEEYETEARDTKLGPEEITRDIPNVGAEALKDLDENGIIRVGAEVRSNDILVGKVTPKGEPEPTAEERLLRAIFGEKAREVRDISLRVPHGESGIIVYTKTFERENGDEMSPGVNKIVRVYIAQRRKISVGDKMAGRHGNKGVISRILPQEDMPFLPDGRTLDIVLNPLGVPSRMNIGQVLEVHLGYAAEALGWKVATPVFDGANEKDIMKLLTLAGKREDGKTILYDGRTGKPFDNPVTVGYMYFLKLAHLVDDKIHARSTGPYSLVTQQPLGGKAQFGGQRFGEMEVWALEAYGAAYTLQEILTVKSDDVVGRVKTYEAIVKGNNVPKAGIPESFKVLTKELQAMGLAITMLDKDQNEISMSALSWDEDIPTGTYICEVPPEENEASEADEAITELMGDSAELDMDEEDLFESGFTEGNDDILDD